jgi:ABC-type multidrug transport system ATPase subunit
MAGAKRDKRVAALSEEFELGAYARERSADLPLGFKQRLALAAAILHDPEILFLDEPTSGVDPLTRREFWRRIDAMAMRGVTVLVTSHFMDEAEYCDRLILIYRGKAIAEGTPRHAEAADGDPRPSRSLAGGRLHRHRRGLGPKARRMTLARVAILTWKEWLQILRIQAR